MPRVGVLFRWACLESQHSEGIRGKCMRKLHARNRNAYGNWRDFGRLLEGIVVTLGRAGQHLAARPRAVLPAPASLSKTNAGASPALTDLTITSPAESSRAAEANH